MTKKIISEEFASAYFRVQKEPISFDHFCTRNPIKVAVTMHCVECDLLYDEGDFVDVTALYDIYLDEKRVSLSMIPNRMSIYQNYKNSAPKLREINLDCWRVKVSVYSYEWEKDDVFSCGSYDCFVNNEKSIIEFKEKKKDSTKFIKMMTDPLIRFYTKIY